MEALRNSRFFYIEGYLMSSDTGFRAARAAQAAAKAAGVRVALTLSDPTMATHFQERFAELIQAGVDLLFCNIEEAMIITGTRQLNSAASALQKRVASFAITLGAEGALVWDGERQDQSPSPPCKPVDTNGAGDMFAGSFLFALNRGQGYAGAAQFANLAASRLVCSFGPRLTAEDHRQILAASQLA